MKSRENEFDTRKKMLQKEIEKVREKLHAALSEGLHNGELYQCSEEMDQLIIRYIEETGQEKQINKKK